MSPLKLWLVAARPRTLPAAVAPVLVGTSLAVSEDTFRPLAFACALIGSIFIQIGTNLSNDYSDARRGADAEDRLGPVRVTASGLVAPRQVLVAAWLAFGVCAVALADGTERWPWLSAFDPVELLEVIALLEETLGRKARTNLLPIQPGDVAATYADVESLQRATGFTPTTSMRDGIRRFVEWYREFYGV